MGADMASLLLFLLRLGARNWLLVLLLLKYWQSAQQRHAEHPEPRQEEEEAACRVGAQQRCTERPEPPEASRRRRRLVLRPAGTWLQAAYFRGMSYIFGLLQNPAMAYIIGTSYIMRNTVC